MLGFFRPRMPIVVVLVPCDDWLNETFGVAERRSAMVCTERSFSASLENADTAIGTFCGDPSPFFRGTTVSSSVFAPGCCSAAHTADGTTQLASKTARHKLARP